MKKLTYIIILIVAVGCSVIFVSKSTDVDIRTDKETQVDSLELPIKPFKN
jgi:hypothetical protein